MIFENEDLVFDLKTRNVLKISERLRKNFGDGFISIVRSLDDFEKFTSAFAEEENRMVVRNLQEKGNQIFNYTIHLNGLKFLINEISWVNQEKGSFHSIIYFQDSSNLFEVSYPVLIEIVEKMKYPAIVF